MLTLPMLSTPDAREALLDDRDRALLLPRDSKLLRPEGSRVCAGLFGDFAPLEDTDILDVGRDLPVRTTGGLAVAWSTGTSSCCHWLSEGLEYAP